ncbi:MAG: MBL fold metallo-hydrolase, partial [Myxococcota bacterium]
MRMLEVEFISHATLKIRGEFGTLLCDPWFLNEPVYNLSTWKFPAATIPPNQVAEGVDYLYITHSHEDHFHLPSLDYIDRDVQVLLPAYDDHPSLRAYTVETVLRGMGFANIRRIRSWETVTLGETPLTVIPAADSRDHDWENSGFLLEHHDSTLLNMNDNVNDEKLCREIHERWPSIDIAFVQSGGVTMYPGCFKMSEAEMRKVATERKLAFREQRRLIELLQPRYVAPFA